VDHYPWHINHHSNEPGDFAIRTTDIKPSVTRFHLFCINNRFPKHSYYLGVPGCDILEPVAVLEEKERREGGGEGGGERGREVCDSEIG